MTTMGPNPFFNAPAVHSHKNCAYCHRFQRCEFKRLQQCGRCHLVLYCVSICSQLTRMPDPEKKLVKRMSANPLARAQNRLQNHRSSEQRDRSEDGHPAWVHRFRTVGRILFNPNEELYGRGSQFTAIPAPRAGFCPSHKNHTQKRCYPSSSTSLHYRHH